MPDGVKTVLVVDDDPDARDFFITVLEDNGYKTVSARDGNEALDRIGEEIPDLITLMNVFVGFIISSLHR